MFVSAEQALEIASDEIARSPIRQDPLFAPWSDASLGQPLVVKNVFKERSYWVVPVVIRGRAAGFVRVMGSGRVAAIGALYRNPDQIEACPATVTGIDPAEASRRAKERIEPARGEVGSEPVFVHDGPPGREAWLVEVLKQGAPSRWIFVTPAFVYERAAGEVLDETHE